MASYKEEWVPRTKVGRLVKEGVYTSLEQIFQASLTIREIEIIEFFLPGLEEEVINVNLVQKQTDAGEKSRFKASVVVGNQNGFVGVGESKAKEIGPAIRSAIVAAKLNIIPVRRGCGSWDCTCGLAHSIPFKIQGKAGSVRIDLKPASRGTGLVAGDTGKLVLRLAGIQDVFSKSRGDTRTSENYAKATFDALRNTYRILAPSDWKIE